MNKTTHTPLRLCALADGLEKMLADLGTDVQLNPGYWAYVVHADKVIGLVRTEDTPIVTAVNCHSRLVGLVRDLRDELDSRLEIEEPTDDETLALERAAAILAELDGNGPTA